MPDQLKTGRQWGFFAKDNGAAVVEELPCGKMYIETYDKKAVMFSAGELKPHASFHIGKIIKWMLYLGLLVIGSLLAAPGTVIPLIRAIFGGG